MMVCGHGDVAEYCRERDFLVCEQHTGAIEDYNGISRVLVTDQEMSETEYYALKDMFFSRGIELVSTRYKDSLVMMKYLNYQRENRKRVYGGRQMFGLRRVNGTVVENERAMAVVRRIWELRDAGLTLRAIQSDEGVHHPDGRKLSISTIQVIINNRKKYEER